MSRRTLVAIWKVNVPLGAFIMVPVFWHMGIFDTTLSMGLLTVPLALAVVGIALRIRDPISSGAKCTLLIGVAWICIILTLFLVTLTSVVHWGFAILACIGVLTGALLLARTIQSFGHKPLGAHLQEM
jgi:hypothetical protein